VHQARDDTHVHLVHLSKARRRFASVHEDDMDSQTMEFVNVAYDDLSSSSDIPSVLDTKRSLVRREVMRDFRRKERQRKMIGTFAAAKREARTCQQLNPSSLDMTRQQAARQRVACSRIYTPAKNSLSWAHTCDILADFSRRLVSCWRWLLCYGQDDRRYDLCLWFGSCCGHHGRRRDHACRLHG
jgi:hypothetical protein